MSDEQLEEKVADMLWHWEAAGESYREFAKRLIATIREHEPPSPSAETLNAALAIHAKR